MRTKQFGLQWKDIRGGFVLSAIIKMSATVESLLSRFVVQRLKLECSMEIEFFKITTYTFICTDCIQ